MARRFSCLQLMEIEGKADIFFTLFLLYQETVPIASWLIEIRPLINCTVTSDTWVGSAEEKSIEGGEMRAHMT